MKFQCPFRRFFSKKIKQTPSIELETYTHQEIEDVVIQTIEPIVNKTETAIERFCSSVEHFFDPPPPPPSYYGNAAIKM
jgi:hypothetical protein